MTSLTTLLGCVLAPSCWSLAGRKASHARQSSLLQKGRWKLRGKYCQALTEVSLDNGDTSLFLSPVPREWSLGLTCCFVSLSGPFVLLPLHPILKMGKLLHHRGNGVAEGTGPKQACRQGSGATVRPQAGRQPLSGKRGSRGTRMLWETRYKWKTKVTQARNSKARTRRGRWCQALAKGSLEWVILIFREALGDTHGGRDWLLCWLILAGLCLWL